MWNSLNLTFTFISVGISCSRCSFTQTGTSSYFNWAICVCYIIQYSSVSLCFPWTILFTSGSHHLYLRLTFNSTGHYLSGCVAASCVVSHRVIRRLEASKHPPLPGETWIIPMPRSPTHAPPQCTTNSAETTNTSSASSESPFYSFNYWCQISSTSCPYVELAGLKARERRDAWESLYPTTHSKTSLTHTLFFPYPTPPSQHHY